MDLREPDGQLVVIGDRKLGGGRVELGRAMLRRQVKEAYHDDVE